MNPKHTVCEGNVNWVNLDQYRINWHRYVDLLFHLRGSHKVLLGVSEFQLFRNNFYV
jgi:hypothetical protein